MVAVCGTARGILQLLQKDREKASCGKLTFFLLNSRSVLIRACIVFAAEIDPLQRDQIKPVDWRLLLRVARVCLKKRRFLLGRKRIQFGMLANSITLSAIGNFQFKRN